VRKSHRTFRCYGYHDANGACSWTRLDLRLILDLLRDGGSLLVTTPAGLAIQPRRPPPSQTLVLKEFVVEPLREEELALFPDRDIAYTIGERHRIIEIGAPPREPEADEAEGDEDDEDDE